MAFIQSARIMAASRPLHLTVLALLGGFRETGTRRMSLEA
jgi:hypothetical protein